MSYYDQQPNFEDFFMPTSDLNNKSPSRPVVGSGQSGTQQESDPPTVLSLLGQIAGGQATLGEHINQYFLQLLEKFAPFSQSQQEWNICQREGMEKQQKQIERLGEIIKTLHSENKRQHEEIRQLSEQSRRTHHGVVEIRNTLQPLTHQPLLPKQLANPLAFPAPPAPHANPPVSFGQHTNPQPSFGTTNSQPNFANTNQTTHPGYESRQPLENYNVQEAVLQALRRFGYPDRRPPALDHSQGVMNWTSSS